MVVKVGVIGVGGMGNLYIRVFKESGRAEVAAIADVDEKRLKQMASSYKIDKAFTDWTKLAEMSSLDAVAICTPPKFHRDQAVAALEAGKHVICEKPPATTVAEAEDMAKAAEKNGRVLIYGLQWRFNPASMYIKRAVENGLLGDIYRINAQYLRRRGAPGGWFRVKEIAGGGPLLDIGVHIMDVAWWMAGKPRPVAAFGATYDFLGGFEVEDTAIGMIRFDTGAVMVVETSWLQNWPNQVQVMLYGTKGGARVFPPELHVYREGVFSTVSPELPKADSQRAKIMHFLDTVEKYVEPIPTASDGVTVMKMIEALYKSAATGRAVMIE